MSKMEALISDINKKAKDSGPYSVYVHISPSNKLYFGITGTSVEQRFGSGGCRYKQNSHLWSAIQKYGWNNFQHLILCSGISQKDACDIEQELILKYNSTNSDFGYNQSIGGEKSALGHTVSDEARNSIRQFQLGRVKSDETRKKLSEAHKGKHKPSLSDEHKQKLSNSLQGKKLSDETKLKISNSRKGMRFTEEHRKKLSEAKRGKSLSDEHKKKISESLKRRFQNNE